MGYVPPVRDQQAFQYGNRLIQGKRGIKPASPVMKGKFHEVLAEQQKQAFYENKVLHEKKQRKKTNHQMVRNLTGKGKYIDEVV